MDALEIARWQFGIVTVYHYLFVPLTIGLAPLVAGLQTAWVRTDDERWLRLTKFFGTLFLINFAMGVVTSGPAPCRSCRSAASAAMATIPSGTMTNYSGGCPRACATNGVTRIGKHVSSTKTNCPAAVA